MYLKNKRAFLKLILLLLLFYAFKDLFPNTLVNSEFGSFHVKSMRSLAFKISDHSIMLIYDLYLWVIYIYTYEINHFYFIYCF